jgi:hypothetical protein
MLQAVHAHALDRVRIFLALTDASEAAAWAAYATNATSAAQLAAHTPLIFTQLAQTSASAFAKRMSLFGKGQKLHHLVRGQWCNLGFGEQRLMAHIKKFHALVEAGERGCEVTWLLDCESLPLRPFAWREVFSRFGKLLVLSSGASMHLVDTRTSAACARAGALVHNAPLTARAAHLGYWSNGASTPPHLAHTRLPRKHVNMRM